MKLLDDTLGIHQRENPKFIRTYEGKRVCGIYYYGGQPRYFAYVAGHTQIRRYTITTHEERRLLEAALGEPL